MNVFRCALLLMGLLAFACKSPTEVVVTIDTNLGVPCDIDALRIEVRGPTLDAEPRFVDLTEVEPPINLSLIPGAELGLVSVTVVGTLAGREVVRATGEATFSDEESSELRFVLDSKCATELGCPGIAIPVFTEVPDKIPASDCTRRAYTLSTGSGVAPLINACNACPGVGAQCWTVLDGDDTLFRDEGEEAPLEPEMAPWTMPFDFEFYGRPVKNMWIGSNGYLTFTDDAPELLRTDVGGDFKALADQTTTFTQPGIAAFAENLTTSEGKGVCMAVQGTAPNRQLWVTWREACFSGDSAPCIAGLSRGVLTFSAGIEETSNNVFIGYHDMLADTGNASRILGERAVIGITRGARLCGQEESGNDGLCDDGTPSGYTQWSAKTVQTDLSGSAKTRLLFVPGK